MRARYLTSTMMLGMLYALSGFAQAPAGQLEVISPNGGEQWMEGSTQIVSWKCAHSSMPDSVQVRLVGSPVLNMRGEILATMRRTDPGVWIWHNVRPAGTNYLIEVTVYESGRNVVRTSNKSFTIVPRKPDKSASVQMSMASSPER